MRPPGFHEERRDRAGEPRRLSVTAHNREVNPRSSLAPENLRVLVQRMKEEQPFTLASARKAKALAKTLEIHAPDRVVAFLAKVVQLDLAKLQKPGGDEALALRSGLQRRLEWLERVLAAEPVGTPTRQARYKYAGTGAAREKVREVMAPEPHDAEARTRGEDELLDFELACLVAYFQLASPKRQMESAAEAAQALPMAAIALSTVSPIFRTEAPSGEAIPMRELQPLLFARDEGGAPVAHLEGLGIRRGDLERAITVLKEARMSFGGPR